MSGVSDIGDILDSVSEERTRELDMILTDREKQKLKQIDDALDRIEEETYGLCEECGIKIPRARLRVGTGSRLWGAFLGRRLLGVGPRNNFV